MTVSELNFSALKHYSTLFRVFVWMKRIRMIALRLVILAFFGFIAYVMLNGKDYSYEFSGTISFAFNPLWLFVLWFVSNLVVLMWMAMYWRRFATQNPELTNMEPKNVQTQGNEIVLANSDVRQMSIPSFRGKKLRMSLYPISGELNGVPFGFFTRQYKEGGLIRWRERQMDTIVWLTLPKKLPNIVIDATANQRARRSNLSKRFDSSWKFQFEGAHGQHYNIYAAPTDRITALQLFTPDVLDVLYASMPTMDIEISGDTIWFVQRYGVLNDVLAKEILTAVERIIPELFKQINSTLVQ